MPRAWRPTPTPAPTRRRLRIEKRLRRYHRRLKDHRPERLDGRDTVDAASYVIEAPPDDESGADSDGFTPAIIAESTTVLKLLSVSDAVTELDMTGAPVVVFRHAAHGGINIVYRRRRWPFRLDRSATAGSGNAH